jgi:uncharacterized ferredoxin-like protein
MKTLRTSSIIVLVGKKSEVLKALQSMSQQFETVQEWIIHEKAQHLYLVK